MGSISPERRLSLGIVVFPGFEPLDVFGPMEIFYSQKLSSKRGISLSIIADREGLVTAGIPPHRPPAGGPVQDFSRVLSPCVHATHSFASAPKLDVLLVPGGLGVVAADQNGDNSVSEFVVSRFHEVEHLLSVCTGAVFLANAGVLEGRRATSNKALFSWVAGHGRSVIWVPSARWVQDGKIWSSSGVAAGMDMTYAFLSHLYGPNDPALISSMNGIEYAPHVNASWDPFSIVHKVPGANTQGEIEDRVRPVGH